MKALTCIGVMTLLLIIWIRVSDFFAPVPESPPIPFGENPLVTSGISGCNLKTYNIGDYGIYLSNEESEMNVATSCVTNYTEFDLPVNVDPGTQFSFSLAPGSNATISEGGLPFVNIYRSHDLYEVIIRRKSE